MLPFSSAIRCFLVTFAVAPEVRPIIISPSTRYPPNVLPANLFVVLRLRFKNVEELLYAVMLMGFPVYGSISYGLFNLAIPPLGFPNLHLNFLPCLAPESVIFSPAWNGVLPRISISIILGVA